ncbi:MAG: GTP-binding protein [Bacteroidota bacterium]
MDILRFLTCGSVDDGKSTLIGRLLYDSGAVSPDVLEAIEKVSRNLPEGEVDLSLLTDGLRAERQQGITIDVAYKYFTTPKRKFIIADTPGHVQYTRNMVTGASTADLAIILIDARHGVIEQTRRHSTIASLLGIPRVLVCINKMDLVDYSEKTFYEVAADYQKLVEGLDFEQVEFVPVSALIGDNVVQKTAKMGWYKGKTLLDHLETVAVNSSKPHDAPRFQVQYVIRVDNEKVKDYRGYAGHIQSGSFKVGDRVTVFPAGLTSEIDAIEIGNQKVDAAVIGQPVVIHLKDDIDITRGDQIYLENQAPIISQDLEAVLCWSDTRPLQAGSKFILQHNSQTVKSSVRDIDYKIDIETLDKIEYPENARLNDLVKVNIRTAEPLAYDTYKDNRETGSFILVNANTGDTVAAGMLQ